MATFTSIALGLGTAMAVVGQIKQGQQQAATSKYNQAVYNQQASAIEQSRQLEADKAERAKRQVAGKTWATTAAQGRTPTGSALEVFLDNMQQMELDQATNDYNLQIQKNQALSGASMSGMEAQTAKTIAYTGAGATLLQGAGMMYSMKKPKLPTVL